MDRQMFEDHTGSASRDITIFLAGDVMTGRGIDQVLPHPGEPVIHEPYMKNALGYVSIAERASGPIPRPADWGYIWGEALAELARREPDVRMINLETSITGSDDFWQHKRINYRMHPDNIAVLTAAGIGYCSLANNHTLDWGYKGLQQTLDSLAQTGIAAAGAGGSLEEAMRPAVLPVAGKGRVVAFSCGTPSSGIPPEWAAARDRAGVNLLPQLSEDAVHEIRRRVDTVRRPRDIVVLSIHWGGNWGYEIPFRHRSFARLLIDEGGVDIIHGHSSHHPLGFEVYQGRPIFYGCGDFINDYEGIGGEEDFRSDLGLMYFLTMNPAAGTLSRLELVPMKIRNFKLNRASAAEAGWLREVLVRESGEWGLRLKLNPDWSLTAEW